MLLPIKLPAGVVRMGTEYGSQGRYYDCWHVRWNDDGTLKPTLGWRERWSGSGGNHPLTGSPRALLAWKDNSGATWLMIGTHSNIYVQNRTGTIFDVTPIDFTAGRADAVAAGGYGDGAYGSGTYGTPRPDSTQIQDATVLSLDSFGQYALAVSPDDGLVYQWGLDTGTAMTPVTNQGDGEPLDGTIVASGTTITGTGTLFNSEVVSGDYVYDASTGNLLGRVAPSGVTNNTHLTLTHNTLHTISSGVPLLVGTAITGTALVVTAEGFLMVLGTTDPRTVTWADQRSLTLWNADATNQAGDFALQTAGRLMCGKSIKGGTLLFTDIDLWVAAYIGGQEVYGFEKVGSACGIISRQAAAALDAQAVWMGKAGFWSYNGYVQKLQCDVQDHVFGNINATQVSKTYCVRDSANAEVTWFYCSGASNEIDSAVVWNYANNTWNMGRAPRTCGTDRGVFTYPIMVDAAGLIYEHEVGLSYGDNSVLPYAEGGPVELGQGDSTMAASWLIPDDRTAGDVTATFTVRFSPDDDAVVAGPFSLTARTGVRFVGRQMKVRWTGARLADWRVGSPRLDVQEAGER